MLPRKPLHGADELGNRILCIAYTDGPRDEAEPLVVDVRETIRELQRRLSAVSKERDGLRGANEYLEGVVRMVRGAQGRIDDAPMHQRFFRDDVVRILRDCLKATP